MPQQIQAPDGSVVEFPDGMNDAQIEAVMRREYGGPDTRQASQGLGFLRGVTKPIDNAALALEAGARRIGLPTEAINRGLGLPSASEANVRRQQAFDRAPERPGMAGQIVGGIVGTIPVAAITKNPFAVGAGQGALLTDKRDVGGVAADAAMGGALGWGAGKVIDAAADVIKPAIAPAVSRLSAAGVRLTPGQIKGGKAMVREDKAMSRPGVGEKIVAGRQAALGTWNTATINKALEPLGVKVKGPGFDAVDEAHRIVGDAYDQVIPNVAVRLDGQQFAGRIAPAARNLKPAEQKHLRQIVSNELGDGQLEGQALKIAQGNIRRLAEVFSRSQDGNQRMLGQALGVVDDELTEAMIAQNPVWAPQLARVNKAFRGLAMVEDAASRADDGVFNTGQLKQAARRSDQSARKNATARGNAFMQDWVTDSRSVIPARTPDSGTAGRLNAGNIFANLKGSLEEMGYDADNLFQQTRLAPRPASADRAAKAVKRLKRPVSAGAVAATHSSRD